MTGTTKAKPLLRVLAGERCSPPPLWLMRQAGRYLPEYRALRKQAKNFLDFCFTPDLAVEATLQPLRRYALDAAILFSDILVVPYARGQKVSFEEGEGPQLAPIRSSADIESLSKDGFEERLAPVYQALRRLRRDLQANVTLIGFAGAPWTVAAYMVEGRGGTGFEHAKRMAHEQPDQFSRLIALLVEQTITHLSAQISAGAETVQLFDSWAGDLEIDQCRRWSLQPLTEIVDRLRMRHPQTPVILFPRGVGELYAEYARIPGLAGLSLDSGVDLAWAAANLQPHLAVQGNLDPQALVAGGPALRQGAERILHQLGGGPLIVNLGHGVVPETPPEHVGELVQLVRGWHG